MNGSFRLAALALALSVVARAQDAPAADTTKRADTTSAPAVNHLATALANVTIGGYVEAAYAYASHPADGRIPGRLYDRFHNQFSLDALKLVLDRPANAAKLDAGFHTDVLFGQNASVVQSTGFDLGHQGDITQLYVMLNIPTADGNGVQLKLGKMATLMGLEVIEDVVNPNWSEGNQFIYLENFTATGASVEHRFNPHLDTQLRLTNGWDVVEDDNDALSFMGRVGVYPDTLSSIAVVGYVGPEQPGNRSALRSGAELLLWRKLTSALSVWVQGDYGHEDRGAALADPARDASWWGLGGWLACDLSPALGIALRGDYMDDANGARTSGVFGFPANTGQRVATVTATLSVREWPHALFRPELRYDHSSIAAFAGRHDELSGAVALAFIY